MSRTFPCNNYLLNAQHRAQVNVAD